MAKILRKYGQNALFLKKLGQKYKISRINKDKVYTSCHCICVYLSWILTYLYKY